MGMFVGCPACTGELQNVADRGLSPKLGQL